MKETIYSQTPSATRLALTQAKRIVVKVGTSTVTHANGRVNLDNMAHLVRSLANQMNQDKEMILVTSGAIGVGVGRLQLDKRPTVMREKQAVAAVGQSELMSVYSRLMNDYHYVVAQILLTRDDIDNAITRDNITNTFEALLERGILPIVNENDTVSTLEILHNGTFGDNDRLSAIVARLIDADLLVILSDIDGLYTSDPKQNADARLIPTVSAIDQSIEAACGGAGSARGTGGMRTKITAARIAQEAGIAMVIANGSQEGVVDLVLKGAEIGTLFQKK